jgi:hypothetical protein
MQVEWVKTSLHEKVLPDLMRAHPDHQISLLSPLTPGAGLILTEASLELLAANRRQHRLLVTEAAAKRDLVEDFEAAWQAGAVGCLDPNSKRATWQETREALLGTIQRLEGHPRCERILELYGPPSVVNAPRPLGYQRQNAYLVQRAHVIIAAVAGTTAVRPGGIGEALTWRRDPAAMPAVMPRYLPRPNRAAEGTPGLIVLDAGERAIRTEAAAP